MLIKIQRAKLLQLFSPLTMDQQRSPCCHNFLAVAQSYRGKVIPIGAMYAEKIAEVVLLYVFRIPFPASLLYKTFSTLLT